MKGKALVLFYLTKSDFLYESFKRFMDGYKEPHQYLMRGKYQFILSPGPGVRIFSILDNKTFDPLFSCAIGGEMEEFHNTFDIKQLKMALGIIEIPHPFFLLQWLGFTKTTHRKKAMTTEYFEGWFPKTVNI